MFNPENFKRELFFTTNNEFESKAIRLFQYQWENNPDYQKFCQNLNKKPANVNFLHEIPFLPIDFFKDHEVKTGSWNPEKTFLSSGTTGTAKSKHLMQDVSFYHQNAVQIFESIYGKLDAFTILALLPSYLEQGDSSLISMVDHFISKSQKGSGFIKNHTEISSRFEGKKGPKLLIGVSFALLDLSEVMVMETGGMKGRRKEIIREELHQLLNHAFRTSSIHSEYGMTELSSQAYGIDGLFQFPKWCRCLIRDINDPLNYMPVGSSGGINVIDLANVDSCAFIETQDLGKLYNAKDFEVLGRFDHADIRGCNLLI
jgi:phenylacetate-coenzyme A ligase PaaK-like adenylate-forming protein